MDSEIGRDAREHEAVRRVCERAERMHPVASLAVVSTTRHADADGEQADLVVSVHDAAGTLPSHDELQRLAARAAKLLVLVLPNPERIGAPRAGELRAATAQVLRALWELGRVREHAYLVLPRPVEIVAAMQGRLAAPDVALAPVGALVRRSALLHALVVDTTPRTPQARRRLRTLPVGRVPGSGTSEAR